MAKDVTPQKPRYAVVVLGMHRSGTSALAGVLGHLGCDLPKTLMPPTETNPKGYFESLRVYNLNDAILASAGSSWDDWQELNPGWIASPRIDEFLQQGEETLSDEFGASPLFVLKDPRMCRMMPFWRRLLEQADIKPLMLHIHRNPLEVAGSLEQCEGLPLAYGLLLWLRHILDAEAGTRGMDRHFTSYGRIVQNWAVAAAAMQTKLGITFPRLSDSTSWEIENFLSNDLRNQFAPAEKVTSNPLISHWIRAAFDVFEAWAEDGENLTGYAVLDKIRAEFNVAAPMFGKLIQMARLSSKETAARQVLEARSHEMTLALEETAKQIDDLRHALDGAQGETGSLKTELQAAQAAHLASRTGAQQVIGQLQAELQEKQAGLVLSQKQATQAVAALESARFDTALLRTDLVKRQNFLETLIAERKLVEQRNAELAVQFDANEALLLETQRGLADLRHEKDQISSALIQRSHEAEDVGRQYAEGVQAQKALVVEIEALRSQNAALAAERQQTDKNIRLLRIKMETQLHKDLVEAVAKSRRASDEKLAELRAQLQARIAQLEADNGALLRSTSWRLTAPLRRLVTLFRR